jgi:hypothetical protein
MRPARCTIPALLLVLAACQQDPYKIKTYTDTGPGSDGTWLDLQGIPDIGPRDADDDGDAKSGHDLSYDACITIPEVCNNVDDNCDGKIDEGFDKQTDPRYCENCKGCMDLLNKNAYPDCVAGKCTIKSCMTGYVDLNGDMSDGCEHPCATTGVEVCDGIDNDCNGKIDDGVTLSQNICKDLGPCKGTTAVCKGTEGWQCVYSADVELQPCTTDADCGTDIKCTAGVCPGIVIVDEKKCDGKDGDCDGLADDPWANVALPNALGKECDLDNPPSKGVCRAVGVYVCDSTGTKAACSKKPCTTNADCAAKLNTGLTCVGGFCTPPSSSAEVCNGKDDDCNGTIDDAVTDEQWVTVGSVQIFKYEASRPDATATSAGINSAGRPCSVPGRLPWGNITKQQAQAACTLAGGRLCRTSEWETACRGSANTTFPYGNTFDPKKCNGRAYDAAADAALTTNLPATCVSTWTGGTIFNMSGNLKEWTATDFSGGNPTGYEIKGGAYDTPSINGFGAGLSCNYDLPAPGATLQIPTLGFRCCK